MRARSIWLVSIALSLALAGAARAQVKIGVAGPITGANAAFGAQLTQGVQQAVEDINKSGGILGQKLEVEPGTTFRIPNRAFRSPTSSSATASSSSSAISIRA